MRGTCARVLAGALMVAAVAGAMALPGRLGGSAVHRALTAPASSLQRVIHVEAELPGRTPRAAEMPRPGSSARPAALASRRLRHEEVVTSRQRSALITRHIPAPAPKPKPTPGRPSPTPGPSTPAPAPAPTPTPAAPAPPKPVVTAPATGVTEPPRVLASTTPPPAPTAPPTSPQKPPPLPPTDDGAGKPSTPSGCGDNRGGRDGRDSGRGRSDDGGRGGDQGGNRGNDNRGRGGNDHGGDGHWGGQGGRGRGRDE